MTLNLQTNLLEWYAQYARVLPWRETRDPYRIWISEVLLQQTQVVTGTVYYLRFLTRFHTVQDLAEAPLEDVLKAWEGCGYYARARNLHAAAQQIVQGGMPKSLEGWRSLKGVGAYTAAAVVSIAYNLPHAVVDGNVRRVLARVYAEKNPLEDWLWTRADELLVREDPGSWNQAVMELGATVCTPKNPRCETCPIRLECAAFATRNPAEFPTPKARAKVKQVRAVALLIGNQNAVYLEQRPPSGLLGGLFGLPLEEFEGGEDGKEAALERLSQRLNAIKLELLGNLTHVFTHRKLELEVYRAVADVVLKDPDRVALPRLDRKALELLSCQKRLF